MNRKNRFLYEESSPFVMLLSQLLQARLPMQVKTKSIWEVVWEYIKPNDFWPYLIIAAIGILFTLIIGDRKSLGEIIKDVLIKCLFLLALYAVVVTVVYFLK